MRWFLPYRKPCWKLRILPIWLRFRSVGNMVWPYLSNLREKEVLNCVFGIFFNFPIVSVLQTLCHARWDFKASGYRCYPGRRPPSHSRSRNAPDEVSNEKRSVQPKFAKQHYERSMERSKKKKKNKISLLYYVQKFQKKLLEDDSRK